MCFIFLNATIENEKEFCGRVCFSFFVPTIENDEKLCVRVCLSFFSQLLKKMSNFVFGCVLAFSPDH